MVEVAGFPGLLEQSPTVIPEASFRSWRYSRGLMHGTQGFQNLTPTIPRENSLRRRWQLARNRGPGPFSW